MTQNQFEVQDEAEVQVQPGIIEERPPGATGVTDPVQVQGEIARQKRATERLTGQPYEDPVDRETWTRWRGYPNFKCKECSYASLNESDVHKHSRVVHLIPRYRNRYASATEPPR